MTSAGPAFQEFTTIFVLGLAMLMLHLCRQDHHLTDGLTVLALMEIVSILVHYPTTLQTQ